MFDVFFVAAARSAATAFPDAYATVTLGAALNVVGAMLTSRLPAGVIFQSIQNLVHR